MIASPGVLFVIGVIIIATAGGSPVSRDLQRKPTHEPERNTGPFRKTNRRKIV
jgi:hypothetical protein